MIPTKTLPPRPHPTYLMYCPYVIFNSNEPIKNAQLQRLANDTLVIEK